MELLKLLGLATLTFNIMPITDKVKSLMRQKWIHIKYIYINKWEEFVCLSSIDI